MKKLKFKTKASTIFNFNLLIFNSRRGGFTLIEIVMIIVIASIAIPTLLLLLGQGAKYGVDAEIRVTEINLAQQLMEEIKSKCWDESKVAAGCTGVGTGTLPLGTDGGGETNGDPATYDDVDDYISGVPDVPLAGITYTRGVQVCYVDSTALDTCVAGPTNYKRISVTVNNPTNSQSVEVVTVATNY